MWTTTMRAEMKKVSKPAWHKTVARKWLNIGIRGADKFHSGYSDYSIKENTEIIRRKSCSDQGYYIIVPEDFSEGCLMEAADGVKQSRNIEPETKQLAADTLNLSFMEFLLLCGGNNEVFQYNWSSLRMFVGTWNVGGKSPHDGLNLRDWISYSDDPADIYVLGFQEIVPLNAGNVLGPEDNGPADKWLSLIQEALNSDSSDDPEMRRTSSSDQLPGGGLKQRLSFSDLLSLEDMLDDEEFGKLQEEGWSSPTSNSGGRNRPPYCLAASKQMVGIFLCVWVRDDLRKHITSLKFSCVGCGIMGYLGNKGSISVSVIMNQMSFCFVCTHLASGEKEGDEVRRNSDVAEILKRTRFSHLITNSGKKPLPPVNILDHDKIIWLGDLNYRLKAADLGYTHQLVKKNDWDALLEKDQLKIEQRAGRVFKGWEEGRICFPPTYKYLTDSDHYVAENGNSKSKGKRRIPAWCDRILWRGDGLKQMFYVRGESRFSDHRPVYSLFSVHVSNRKRPNDRFDRKPNCPRRSSTSSLLQSACVPAKVQAEELLEASLRGTKSL